MKIAFLADPLSGFKIYKDSTFAMMREAARRGHQIYAFEQRHMVLDRGVVTAEATEITADRRSGRLVPRRRDQTVRLSEFDAVIQRKDPPFDMEYVYGTYLLELAERQGARVFNKPRRSATTTRSWPSPSSASSPRRPWCRPRRRACAPSTPSTAT
jgi:glutathione synthase